jgi:AcrR family transcriptional regulator
VHEPREEPVRRPFARRRREERVSEILDAAREVFAERGYDEALLSEIAARAGVVEGTIYRYFRNKYDLLLHVLEAWYAAMLADDQKHLAGIQGNANRLRYVIWRVFAAIREEPGLSRLFYMKVRPDPGYRGTRVFELNMRYVAQAVRVMHEAVQSGEFRRDVPLRLVRDMIYGCIEHHTWSYLRGEGDFDPAAAADQLTRVILHGMAAGAEQDGLRHAADRLERLADRLERAAQRREEAL